MGARASFPPRVLLLLQAEQVATAAPARACKHAARPSRPTAAAAPLDACARGCATADAARSPPRWPPTSPARALPPLLSGPWHGGHDSEEKISKVEDGINYDFAILLLIPVV